MNYYIMETAAWLLAAFFVGAFLGCMIKNLFARKPAYATAGAGAAAATAGAAVAVNRTPSVADVRIADADRVPVRPVDVPVPDPVLTPPPPITSAGDVDLKRIRAVGPDLEVQLNKLGISNYEQIANWSSIDVDRISQALNLTGRIERENWIEQAAVLARGGNTLFSSRVGRGDYLSINAAAYDAPYDGDSVTPHVSHVPAQVVEADALSEEVARIDVEPVAVTAAPQTPVDLTSAAAAAVAAGTAAAGAVVASTVGDTEGEASAPADTFQSAQEPQAAVAHDDFKKIEGIGPSVEQLLIENGAITYADIAAWKREEVDYVNSLLKNPGRVQRENWIEQAAVLATSKDTYFSKRLTDGTTVAPLTEEDVELYDAAIISDEEVADAMSGTVPADAPQEPQPFTQEAPAPSTSAPSPSAPQNSGSSDSDSIISTIAATAATTAGVAAVGKMVSQPDPAPVPAPEPPLPVIDTLPEPSPEFIGDATPLDLREQALDKVTDALSEEIEDAAEDGYASEAGANLEDIEEALEETVEFQPREEASVELRPVEPVAPTEPVNLEVPENTDATTGTDAGSEADDEGGSGLASMIAAGTAATGAAAASILTGSTDAEAETSDAPADTSGLRSVRSDAYRGDSQSGSRIPRPVTAGASGDDLKRIRGIGVIVERKLNGMGVNSYAEIAQWTEADIENVNEQLDFMGRIERENWVEQAKILSGGGATDFARRVDRGEVES